MGYCIVKKKKSFKKSFVSIKNFPSFSAFTFWNFPLPFLCLSSGVSVTYLMSFVNHKGWWKAQSNNSLSICLSIYLAVSPHASLPDCLGVSVSNMSLVCLSHCPHTPQLGSLPTRPPACQSFYLIACLFGQPAAFFHVRLSPCRYTHLPMSLSVLLHDWQISFRHLQVLSCLIFILTNKDRLTKEDVGKKWRGKKTHLRFMCHTIAWFSLIFCIIQYKHTMYFFIIIITYKKI